MSKLASLAGVASALESVEAEFSFKMAA